MPGLAIPQLTFLSDDQIQTIHSASLRILAETGVRVDSAAALAVFSNAAGAELAEGGRVRLAPELVEWALQAAPQAVEVFDRTGELRFRLGLDRARFGAGVTNLFYQDPRDDSIAPFTRAHMTQSVRLANCLPHYDVVSTIGVIQDYPPETADLFATLEMAANTTKPLVLLISDEHLFRPALDLLEHLHGPLGEKPFILPYFNPITPLVINEGTADKMLEAIGRGLPVIYSNYSMAGMSTPITPAGTLALMNAELLAGLVLAQLARPGTPVILGSLPAYFDMRQMKDYYDPQTILLNLACAEMLAHYKLPHAGTSGSGLGYGADLAESGLLWMNHLSALLGKVGLAPFVGGALGSKAFSPTQLVYAHEIIDQAIRFSEGFQLDEETLALDEIAQRGPGGNFLDSDMTLRLFRKNYYESKLFPRWSLEKWQELGRPRLDDRLRQHTLRLLESAQPPADAADLVAKGEAWIAAHA